MSKFDIRKKFLKLAYDQLNPNVSSVEGLEQALSNWYCFQYNVPPNDDKLLEMTLEELMVLYQMHRLRENPQLIDEISTEKTDSYEDWLKKEMGENYISNEDMVEEAEKLEKEERAFVEKHKEKFPDRISTDFSSLSNEE